MKIGCLSTVCMKTDYMTVGQPEHVGAQQYISQDYAFAWSDVLPLLQSHQVNILNPQSAVYSALQLDRIEDVAKLLQIGNIQAINGASGKILHEKLPDIVKTFAQTDIGVVGIGQNFEQAKKPLFFEKDGVKIGVIGFSNKKEHRELQADKPQLFYVPFGDISLVQDMIAEVKGHVDLLIVTVQWGSDRQEPDHAYRQFAHALIDAGVDIVHGESDHVYLGVEKYNDKLIMYDSGDFVQMYMTTDAQQVPRSFVYTIDIDEQSKIKQVQLTPVLILEQQLKIAQGQNKTEAIQLMQNISMNLGTQVSDSGVVTF